MAKFLTCNHPKIKGGKVCIRDKSGLSRGVKNNCVRPLDIYELHRLLGALLSKKLSPDEKLNIIETEYDIPIEDSIRRDVSVMCNLSQGIREDALEEIIINMRKKGYTLEQIADVSEKSIEEVETIIEKREPVLV